MEHYNCQPIPCRLDGYTYGPLNAWAQPGACVTDTWLIKSTCGTVSIRVNASTGNMKVNGTDSLATFYYD
jgi:hypothetical protein